MKAITKHIALALLATLITVTAFAQRKISGTVYNNGEPAAGILVEAHRTSDSYYTSFDGQYELEVSEKSKWIRFTFLDETRKIDISDNATDVLNYSWDGSEIPDADEAGVILKTLDELRKENDSEFINNYSLYREFIKQNNYKSALPYWKIIYKTYPKSTEQIYRDGAEIMKAFMNEASDTDNKKAYLDTMMQIYDKRMKYMDNVGAIMGLKAADYIENILKLDISEFELADDLKKGYEYAQKSIEESGKKTEPRVIVLFLQTSRKLYSMDEFTAETVLEDYEKSMDIIDSQLKDEELKDKANQVLPILEQIIEGSGAMDCEAMNKLYSEKYKENPNDIDFIKKALRSLNRSKCDNKLVITLSEKLYELEPSSEAAFNMARTFLKKENYTKAFEYYEKACNSSTDNNEKALYYYESAGLSLQQGMLEKARDFAKKAIGVKPDYCEAYMLIGEIYIQASKDFSDDSFERSTVFWLATDYFEKAARYADCKTDAQNKISTYQNYFPNKEEVFFKGLEDGKNHYIGGWINETTKVRVK
ncbi:MAG: hypothetical protein JXR50_10950 [Prolixibacteraceae bacterium]|nr:hypothetical protein [Prolixibacteraceae bacterium]MBN2650245.1 hypothetical protein [Prolixibacteraceae bacterium]